MAVGHPRTLGEAGVLVPKIGYYDSNLKEVPLQGRVARRLGIKRDTIVPRATIPAETQKPVMNPCSVGAPLATV